jgi:hypothetical protein
LGRFQKLIISFLFSNWCTPTGVTLLNFSRFTRCPPWFSMLGYALIVQGGLSYMADVRHYAEQSKWLSIDRVWATVTGIYAMIAISWSSYTGKLDFSRETRFIWMICCIGAVSCKIVGAYMSRRGSSIQTLMIWHNLWHALPVIGGVLLGVETWRVITNSTINF